MKNKDKQPSNLSKLGWTLADFGINRQEYLKANQPSDGFSPNYVTGVSGGFNQPPLSPVPQKLSDFREAVNPNDFLPDMERPGPSAQTLGLINPQEKTQVQDFLDDQSVFEQASTRTKRFLSRLFDTEEERDSFVGSSWQNFLKGVGWFYDRINQVGVVGLSALPGGIQTLSWEEANEVSFGQAAVANAALSARSIEQGNILSALPLVASGPLAGAGAFIGSDVIGSDFDITDPEQRKRAFEEDSLGKWSSGLTDAVFVIAADPLIIGGKFLKVARVKWVDKPIVSQTDIRELTSTLARDQAAIAAGRTDELSSYGRFLNWVGEEGRRFDDVYNHTVIRDATGRDELTALLMNADNFAERALVMRTAYGDRAARLELNSMRSDLADLAGKSQRERLEVLGAMSPQEVNKIKDVYRSRADELQMEYDRLATIENTSPRTLAAVDRKKEQYISLVEDLDNGNIFRDVLAKPLTKEELKWGKTVVNDFYVTRDAYLRKAIEGEYTLIGLNRQMAANNPFGRFVEGSRQRRAVASADAQGATLKSIWKSEDYTPLGKAGRTVRLWRWAGKEKPSGYIVTRGSNIQEQFREVRAGLDNVNIYNLPGKQVVVDGRTVTVGGRERREELIRRYMDAVGPSIEDQNKVALAVNALEGQIIKDMAMWHGFNARDTNLLISKMFSKRKELIDDIKSRGFWVEDGVVNKVPFLESQLQNGTYLMNYRAINRAMGLAEKQGLIASLNSAGSYGADKAATLYNAFNSVWRPAVLLRLGYAQRNAVEGLFRSSAFLGSFAPLVDATKAAGLGFRNLAVPKAVKAEAARVEKMLTAGESATRIAGTRFGNWRETQRTVGRERLKKEETWIAETKKELNKLAKNDPDRVDIARNINIIESQLVDTRTTLRLLDDDYAALAMYRGQAGKKRRLFDGEYNSTDPLLQYKAFGDPRFADLAYVNMSADGTTRATLTLRMQTSNKLLQNTINKHYVSVNPSNGDDYFRGVAEMLKQFRASSVGRKIINGEDPVAIAAWLRTSNEGKQIVDFLNGVVRVKKGSGSKASQKPIMDAQISSADDALDYVMKLTARLDELTPNPALKRALLDDKAVLSKNFWEDVKRLLDTDAYREMLVPAIGNVAKETGWKSIRDSLGEVTQKGFQLLGTIPEDVFVRAPFYARRYNDTRETMYRQLVEQTAGKTVPFSEIQRIERIAHRRALKDTKDWLYTIERRTNLGHYGEYVLPFISAAQNSVTALGRLAWRDPSLVGVVNLLWQAPTRAGLEDDEGRIVIPMPQGLVPDGILERVGLDNMRNIKINKGSLNVIFPESGFAVIPRPGPIVGVPVSEFMKSGLLTVETPEILRGVLGEQVANEFWNTFRTYIFGEQSGLSAETLSWNMFAPPAIAKIVQMVQGEAGSTSYAYMYNLQYRTELAKVLAGERDFPGTMDEFKKEIKDRTNGMFLLRMAANMLAFTPPQYESKLEPLIRTIRKYEEDDPDNGLRKFNDDYGNMLLMLGKFNVSQNVAGVRGEVQAVANARKYENILSKVAPNVQNDLGVLGIILNEDTDGLYDGSAYAWQRNTRIPGINRTYREIQTPEQAMVESSKNAGWTKYISFMDELDAILQQRGLTSYRGAGAEDLKQLRDSLITQMRENPMYSGWYSDFVDFGSTRTVSAVKVLEAALSDPKFVDDHEDDPVWISAAQYLELRRDVIELVRASGSGINAEINSPIRELWDSARQRLVNQSTKWATIANRYLNGDDDPTNPGADLSQSLTWGGGKPW